MSFIRTQAGFLKTPGGRGITRSKPASASGLIPGAVAIWRGDVGVSLSGSNVATWTDSVSGLVLTAHDTPAVVASPAGTNAIGMTGDDGLNRTGVGNLPVGNAARTVIWVAKYVPDGPGWAGFLYGNGNPLGGFGLAVAGNDYAVQLDLSSASIKGPSVNSGDWFVATAVYSGATASLYFGSDLVGTLDQNINTGSDEIVVGRGWANSYMPHITGAIYVYPFAFTAAQVARMVDYVTPLWITGTPFTATLSNLSFVATSDTGGDFNVTTDYQGGTIFGVLTSTATRPSNSQIIAGTDHLDNIAPAVVISGLNQAGAVTRAVSGLQPSTTYYPHAVQRTEYGVVGTAISGTSDTTDASPPPPDVSIDVTVSTAAELNALLTSWSGTTNWDNTAAGLGKATTDPRTIGVTAPILNSVAADGKTFPQLVTIRSVGAFVGLDASVYFNATVKVSGTTNLRFYLCDFRAPGGSAFSNGFITCNNTVDVTFRKCTFSGVPFPIVDGVSGSTRYALVPQGSTRLSIINCTYRYFGDGLIKFGKGTHTAPLWRGNCGRYSGGDDITLALEAHLVDPVFEYWYADRHHAKEFGTHNDVLQKNDKLSDGTISSNPANMTRATFRYCVFYRGLWTGAGAPGSGENGWQCLYMSPGNGTGPDMIEQCLFINGQQRGHDANSSATASRYNTFIEGDFVQYGNARYPRPVGGSTFIGNFVACQSDTQPAAGTENSGTGGIRVNVNGDFAGAYAPYMEGVPSEATGLYEIRPKITGRMHPDYAVPSERVGCYDLWAKLLASDDNVVLSNVGWPVATMWVEDFDPNDDFGDGTYTGNFDSNGNNI
jgi:hypothetical protein